MFNMFSRTLKDALNETKRVKIEGVIFKIKKIDVASYLKGTQSLISVYDTYKMGNKDLNPESDKTVRAHFRDVFMEGVVKPVLSRKDNETGVHVDEMFNNWDLANGLYSEIINFTYGKKKVSRILAEKNSVK